MSPFEICDQIEREFGIETVAADWPIGDGERFKGRREGNVSVVRWKFVSLVEISISDSGGWRCGSFVLILLFLVGGMLGGVEREGVYKRATKTVDLYERSIGGKSANVEEVSMEDPRLVELIGDTMYEQLLEDVEILDTMSHEFDAEKFLHGDQTIVYFGSAMTNFGVQVLLDDFLNLGRSPCPRDSSIGEILPTREDFSGFVFKLQANMDPRHRDRLAFIRIVSGVYSKGMKVSVPSTNAKTHKANADDALPLDTPTHRAFSTWLSSILQTTSVTWRGLLRCSCTVACY